MRTNRIFGLLVLGAALVIGACDLELTDPNSPNEQDIITTADGLIEVAVGLQAEWGDQLVDPVYIQALATDGIGAIPQAFESYRLVDAGDPITNDLGPSTETWAGMYDVVLVADVLLANVPGAPMTDETKSGILAMAQLFKAMAFGNLLQVYERIPLDVGLDNLDPEFATRDEGWAEVLRLLNAARTQLQTTPPGSEFEDRVLAEGFDLENTIDAMIARFALIAGDLDQAMDAAQRVDLDVLSEFRFSATDPNSIWVMMLGSGNAFRLLPEDAFRLNAQPGDARVAYWVSEAATTGSTAPLDAHAKYSDREANFAAYYPDEMRLIMAEVHARMGNLPAALTLVNEVRTQCSSAFDEPTACLPALTAGQVSTQQAMLDAILLERQYELYLQAVSWSDLRRFGKPLKYQFMMVSEPECERNSNTPPALCGITQ